ncbi:MAG: TonB family protein [Verrucomicrobiota bacterium]
MEEPRWPWAPTLAMCGALVLAGLLFLVIPISHMQVGKPLPDLRLRKIRTVNPMPPKAPPPRERRVEEETPLPPQMPRAVAELTLAQLDIELVPGTGDALALGLDMDGFAPAFDGVAEIEKIFDFSELPQVPGLLFIPEIQWPRDLARRGIKSGEVVLLILIDKKGKPRVESIRSSTHPSLEAVARHVAERARFSVSEVNGEAIKVRGEWPLILQAPR